MEKIGIAPMRINPTQKGHVFFAKCLFEELQFDIFGVIIGSCYEAASARHAYPAFLREKMYLKSCIDAGIDPQRLFFFHLPDYRNLKEWWEKILFIADKYHATHFITGNKIDVINPVRENGFRFPFEWIDPEESIPAKYVFPYHSTDLRNAARVGDYRLIEKIAGSGTMLNFDAAGGIYRLLEALDNKGTPFIPGRQTVDLIVTCLSEDNDLMVLCGYRDSSKENFPNKLALPGGEINFGENPMDASVREGGKKTGINIEIVNRWLEPSHIVVRTNRGKLIAGLRFVGIFSSEDVSVAGNQGGSSQVFHAHLRATPKDFDGMLKSESNLRNVAFRSVRNQVLKESLAYQHKEMLKKALGMI